MFNHGSCTPGDCSCFSRRRSLHTLLPQHRDVISEQPIICKNHPGQLQVPHWGRTSLPPLTCQVCQVARAFVFQSEITGWNMVAVIILSFNLCVFVLYREIELPLHDNGMEPVEFLKSMGISLTPLNEVTAGNSGSRKVFLYSPQNLKFCLSCPILSMYIVTHNCRQVNLSNKYKGTKPQHCPNNIFNRIHPFRIESMHQTDSL